MIRVGIIGIGNISGSHIDGYRAFGDRCKIVAFCDLDEGKATRRAAELGLGISIYEDASNMLQNEDLDLVSIATPPDTHADLTIVALDQGVNVLVEKPMAPSLEECDRMIAAQERSGKLLSVVAQNRFRNDTATLKSVIDSGLIGPVSHVQVDSLWWRGLPYYDLWWRGTWGSEGGGCTLNHAIHHLDLLCWLMGMPESILAAMTNAQHENAEVEDLSIAIMTYQRALAQVTSSVVHHGQEAGITVQGRDAKIAQPWAAAAELTQANGFPSPEGNPELVGDMNDLAQQHEPLPHVGHAGQIGDVLSALETPGGQPSISGQDGRNAVEMVTAIYASAIERTHIELPISQDNPFYQSGALAAEAPRFYRKTNSVREQAGDITVGVKSEEG